MAMIFVIGCSSCSITRTASGIGRTMISEKDGVTLLYVPAGKFTMGSDDGQSNEKPAHMVYLDAFWIDQTEVTNLMFAGFFEPARKPDRK